MSGVYAIGDLHGRPEELDRVLALIEADGGRDAPVVVLGDLVDRGPDSRGVIDRLLAGLAEGRPWTVLLGNHDRMFLRFLEQGATADRAILSGAGWLHSALGGAATLAAYGLQVPRERLLADPAVREELRLAARAAVPEAHRLFLAARPLTHHAAGALFVHAGLRPGVPLDAQVEDDLVWIREPFLSDPRDHGMLVVHGHTVTPAPRHHGNRLAIDTGAGYGEPATAALVEGRRAWALEGGGRWELVPSS